MTTITSVSRQSTQNARLSTPTALSGSRTVLPNSTLMPRKTSCVSCTKRLIMSDTFRVKWIMGRTMTWLYMRRRMSMIARHAVRLSRYSAENRAALPTS